MPKIPFEFLIRIGGNAKGPHLEDLGIEKCIRIRLHVLNEGADKVLRLTATRANKYSIAPMDMTEYPLLGQKFFLDRKMRTLYTLY